jgi:imidazolonepropionase-like amidohydrolase
LPEGHEGAKTAPQSPVKLDTCKRRETIVPKRVLLRGGHVLSMDQTIGDIYGGDVLIEDDRIAAVGASVDVGDAEVIRAPGNSLTLCSV